MLGIFFIGRNCVPIGKLDPFKAFFGKLQSIGGDLFRPGDRSTGEFPIIGVNTFLNKAGSPTILPAEVIRSTREEKNNQVENLKAFHGRHKKESSNMLSRLQEVALTDGNLFEELMETVKYCSLGQITHALYEVGGQYRRNM